MNNFIKRIQSFEISTKYKILYFIFIFINLSAQKGVTNLSTSNEPLTNSATYAVIIGISDYQSPQIPDLQYADRDAIAFANWLRSPAGGKVKEENVILLVNDSATTARFMEALNWLMDQTNEGDQAVIYFSGHGDVESKLRDQLGFLLCYDSPARNYAAGSCAINYLQSVISTISLDKKGKVLMITDACHAGKLAGSKINGSGITNANLAQQFANEVKILSCQQNEFSLEGKEWGNGRGVFSWVLIDGLNGMADANEDNTIGLMEIGRYLEERVPSLTAPHQQIPITVGDRVAVVAKVDYAFKKEIQKDKSREAVSFVPTNMRGMESGYISTSDSTVQKKYKQFLAAIESHKLMSPKDSCANDLYEALKNEKSLEPLHNLMRRNLAIALQDEVQQTLNAFLEDDPYVINQWDANTEKYKEYPEYLRRAMELLGPNHFAHNSLESKKLYFEGYQIFKCFGNSFITGYFNDSLKQLAKAKYKEALILEPNAAYLYNAMAALYTNMTPCQADSVVYWNGLASTIAPNWLKPILESGFEYLYCENNACKAEPWIEKAYQLRSESYWVQMFWSWLLQWENKNEESKSISLQMIKDKPELFNAYATLAVTLSKIEGDYKEGELYARKAMKLGSGIGWIQEALSVALINTGRYQDVLDLLKDPVYAKIIEKDPNYVSYRAKAYYYLKKYKEGLACVEEVFKLNFGTATYYHVQMKFWQGRIYLAQGKVKEAKEAFHQMFVMDKTNNGLFVWAYAYLAECNLIEKDTITAETNFIKAINYHFCGDGMDTPEPREEAHYLYGRFLLNQNRVTEAKIQMEKSLKVRRMGYWGEYGIAVYYAVQGNSEISLKYLELACNHKFPHFNLIMNDPAFSNMKKNLSFKSLIKKYK